MTLKARIRRLDKRLDFWDRYFCALKRFCPIGHYERQQIRNIIRLCKLIDRKDYGFKTSNKMSRSQR